MVLCLATRTSTINKRYISGPSWLRCLWTKINKPAFLYICKVHWRDKERICRRYSHITLYTYNVYVCVYIYTRYVCTHIICIYTHYVCAYTHNVCAYTHKYIVRVYICCACIWVYMLCMCIYVYAHVQQPLVYSNDWNSNGKMLPGSPRPDQNVCSLELSSIPWEKLSRLLLFNASWEQLPNPLVCKVFWEWLLNALFFMLLSVILSSTPWNIVLFSQSNDLCLYGDNYWWVGRWFCMFVCE